MSKSLTETAKSVLMKESNDATPDRDAQSMTDNAKTLSPMSKDAEQTFSNPDAMAPDTTEIQDMGPAVVNPTDKNGIFGVAEKIKKTAKRMADKEGGEMDSVDPSKTMSEENDKEDDMEEMEGMDDEDKAMMMKKMKKEKMDEEYELSEEVEALIDEMLEEGASEEEIMTALEEHFETISEEDNNFVQSFEVDLDEHVEALFEGEDLSEEFKEKAKTIFEAALNEKLKSEVAVLEKAYAEALEEEVEQIQESLSENVDGYLNYVVENWVTENEVAIESGLRSELTEDFISGLKALFEEHYIDIPEDKVSVVESLQEKVDELENKLNEEIDRNVQLSSIINESRSHEIVLEACEGLTATQAAKLQSLAENVNFNDEEEFAKKIETIKESYFPTSVKNEYVLTEEVIEEEFSDNLQGPMAAYVKSLGKIQK